MRAALDRRRGLGYLAVRQGVAGITQLVECKLPKLDVAGSNPVARSSSHRSDGARVAPSFFSGRAPEASPAAGGRR